MNNTESRLFSLWAVQNSMLQTCRAVFIAVGTVVLTAAMFVVGVDEGVAVRGSLKT